MTVMLAFLLSASQLLICVSSKLTKFGFATSSDRHAGTSAVIKTTFWFNHSIFSCDITPKVDTEWWLCEENGKGTSTSVSWTEVKADPACNKEQYKIMMDNSYSTESVIIDIVGFWTQTTKQIFYTANQFCIPNGAHTTFAPVTGGWWPALNLCNDTHQPHDRICINNVIGSCGPGKQMIILNTKTPNTPIMNALWKDATYETGDPLICTTLSPTDDPTDGPTINPTISPTKATNSPSTDPTLAPTKKPTISPTKKPTKSPTISPTNKPSISPTEKPTLAPTYAPIKKPTRNPNTEPTTKHPTLSPTKRPTNTPTDAPAFRVTSKNPTRDPISDGEPSMNPTIKPSVAPTNMPSESLLSSQEANISPTEEAEGSFFRSIDWDKYMRQWPIVVGIVAFLCISIIIVTCLRRLKKKKKAQASADHYVQLTMGSNISVENDTLRKADTAGTLLDAYDL